MRRKVVFRGTALPLALLAPQLAVTAVFFLWPAGVAIYQSVLQQDAWGLRTEFVGLRNFAEVLADPGWREAAWTTAVFSSAVAAVLWLFIFHPSIGLVGRALNAGGIPWDPRLNGGQAMALVVLAAAWKQVSYNFIFFLAGLQAIPKSVLEAAAIDGARPVRRFWTVVFPLLSPTTFFLLVVNLVYAFFDTFGTIHALTGGGPGKATETLIYKVYVEGVQNTNLGSSAAQSVILMLLVVALTMAQFRFVERRVHY